MSLTVALWLWVSVVWSSHLQSCKVYTRYHATNAITTTIPRKSGSGPRALPPCVKPSQSKLRITIKNFQHRVCSCAEFLYRRWSLAYKQLLSLSPPWYVCVWSPIYCFVTSSFKAWSMHFENIYHILHTHKLLNSTLKTLFIYSPTPIQKAG